MFIVLHLALLVILALYIIWNSKKISWICYKLDNREISVYFRAGGEILLFLPHPNCLWDPSIFLSNGYHSSFLEVKLHRYEATTHLHWVLRLKMQGATSPFPHMPSWCDIYLSTGTTLFLLKHVFFSETIHAKHNVHAWWKLQKKKKTCNHSFTNYY